MTFKKGHKPTEAMKAGQREGQARRWAKFYADPESPEALEYRAKISAVQLERHVRYNAVMALLNG